MKVIFLDMDGVLNSLKTKKTEHPDDIDSTNLAHFSRIMARTDAKIVISSSWRHCENLVASIRDRFGEEGYAHRIISMTPDHGLDPRCYEIEEWLNEHEEQGGEEVEKFAILDDDGDACNFNLQDSFFGTNAMLGLTAEIAENVIKHLNGIR